MKKALLLSLLLVLCVVPADTAEKPAVKDVRFSSNKSYTRVVIDVSGPVQYTKNRLQNPDRLFFDLRNCSISPDRTGTMKIDDGIVRGLRLSQFDHGTTRIVFDLQNSEKFYAFTLNDPFRLVVDLYGPQTTPGSNQVNKTRKLLVDRNFEAIKTVVIDPGHGGEDPGAIGPRGLKEKDIVLDVGKSLGRILEQKHGLNVKYTRDRDVYIPLTDRTQIANSNDADLFISIHVNASERRSVRGIETYFLNWTNDREAMRVAARENKISVKKMKKMQDELQFILQDLARKNKNEESMKLAYSVQNTLIDSLKKDYGKIENLGVKYALFYVLVGAEMPSILVEISFISNFYEEKRLSGEKYRNSIARAIADGISSYITQSTLIVKRSGDSI